IFFIQINLKLLANIKKFAKWKIYFSSKQTKTLSSNIIKSIFISILHKLKKEKYIVGTCFA
ncbi:hypothetical protein K3F58_05555, partial [Acinetobacter nosocomialis]|uniref:hypothetical protein n=1 Tax=Acinetobacter nosocomialis TaxID=106654 RepID=UPI00233FEDE8